MIAEIGLTLKSALSLLSRRDRSRLSMIAFFQILMALLDLVSVALIGFVVSLSLFGIQSREAPDGIYRVLEIIHLDSLTFQQQVGILGVVACTLLIGKTIISSYLSRRILLFLYLKTARVSSDLLERILVQPLDYFKSTPPTKMLFSITRGVQSLLIGVLGSFSLLFSEIALLVVVFVGLFIFDPVITSFSILYFGIIGVFQSRRFSDVAEFSQSESVKEVVKSESQILESFNLYRELHVRNARRKQVAHITGIRERMAFFSAQVAFMPYISKYSIEISLVLGSLILTGTQFFLKDAFSALTTLSIFLVASSRITPSFLRIQQGIIQIRTSKGDSKQTLELIHQLQNVNYLSVLRIVASPPPLHRVEILVENLTFKYRDASVVTIRGVSFEVQSGSVLALVGPSGSGKSTILDLLMGALMPVSGCVKIGGFTPIEFVSAYPGQLGYVAQETIFANATIRENLILGLDPKNYSDEKLWDVLRRVGLEKAFRELNVDLNSTIGERGSKLSSGQKQRLSVARALLTSPKVLLLDEPTSSLDKESEGLITELISSLKGKTTIVVIAHRLETIKSADQIVYIEAGSVKRKGTYEEIFGSTSFPLELEEKPH